MRGVLTEFFEGFGEGGGDWECLKERKRRMIGRDFHLRNGRFFRYTSILFAFFGYTTLPKQSKPLTHPKHILPKQSTKPLLLPTAILFVSTENIGTIETTHTANHSEEEQSDRTWEEEGMILSYSYTIFSVN